MTPSICFYFQVHQPYRLRDIRITEVGSGNTDYFDHQKNHDIFRKVAEKCYLPANALMLDLLNTYPEFRISYSLSGVFIDQCREYGPDVLASFQRLADTGKVEFMAETYYHSLSSLTSPLEYCEQVSKHVRTMEELFGQTPAVFRNTELIYNNHLAHMARLMGFVGILAEGADSHLENRSPNQPFVPPRFRMPSDIETLVRKNRPLARRSQNIHVLTKNYRLSDDVAFRFSDRSWVGYPLHADTFTDWLTQSSGHSVNLFMDYETFGEHQWADTGIFDFLGALPRIWQDRGITCETPSEVIRRWRRQEEERVYNVHNHISWADMERDLSAWRGNLIQDTSFNGIYALEEAVKNTGDDNVLETWRRLQTSDHFYYMCTKFWSDGDVHKYFSPYDSPYEAYRRYSHALHDLHTTLGVPPTYSAS